MFDLIFRVMGAEGPALVAAMVALAAAVVVAAVATGAGVEPRARV